MRPVPPLLRVLWLAVLLPALASPVGALTCPDPPLYPPTRAYLQPPRPCPGQDVRILFATCAPCWDIVNASETPDGITVWTEQRQAVCVPTVCLPESTSLGLGTFAAGHYAVVVRFITTVVVHGVGVDTVHCTFVNMDTLRFDVAPTCAQDTLPYVKEIVIGGPAPCALCPPRICAGDSIPVLIRGELPDNCIALAGVDLIPDRSMSAILGPPTLRINYVINDCLGRPCSVNPVPWEARVKLPPLPALSGHVYWLQAMTTLSRIQCSGPPDSSVTGEARFPFAVAETCSTTAGCFLTSFETVSSGGSARCDAFVGPGHPAFATFRIGSGVPLNGLEGRFHLDSPQLAVTGIETVGAAAGMRLVWQATDDGARFVLFSEGGTKIPAAPPMPSSGHLPILRVRVELRATSVPPPARITMRADGLLGADANGQGVNLCPILFLIVPFDSYTDFCTEGTCDFNRDGSTDVRDLVGMVNCLNDSARCDLTHADCNGDGGFNLDDVLCCAHVLLGGGQPDTTGGRPDPSLRVKFGAPVEDAGTFSVPVTLEGANPVAGARLVLSYPSDRFDVAGVDFPGRSSWLELHEVSGGHAVVGLLDLGGAPSTSFHHSFTLRLALRAGQKAGGQVAVEAAEFSDPHGVTLIADLGSPSVMIGGGPLALGPGQPNPFGSEVSFGVTLAEAADLEVSIIDLTGRLVSTLHRGPAAPGGQTFVWDGRNADGSRAPEGIYFYRARAAGQTLSRKVILLRQP